MLRILIIVIIVGAVNCDDHRCPDAKEIHPCSCDLEGISCFTIKTEDELIKTFQAKTDIKAARAFWLNGTPLKLIKKESFNEYKFQHVYLDKNELEVIESGFLTGSEETLQTLSVYDNQLKDFPFSDLKNFKKLTSLSLASNVLTNVPQDALKGSSALSSVLLRNNQISSIGKDAFYGVDTLESLDLSHNLLTKLDANSLSISSPGVVISLASNKITTIDKNAFLWTNLLQLDLSGNLLKNLESPTFYPIVKTLLSNHGAMLLGDNPLSCSGCNEWKWIVDNGRILSRMLVEFECINGNTIHDLDYHSIGCESLMLN